MNEQMNEGGKNVKSYVLGFQDIDAIKPSVVGGKGANLGALSRITEIHVPDGFCLTVDAFQSVIGEMSSINDLLDQLSLLKTEDRHKISHLSGEIRRIIEEIPVPEDIANEVSHFLSRLGENDPYAVRSSATAEDLPTASFAGQQDTYLNVIGKRAILEHISKCWASLFTERAAAYRIQNGFDHRKVSLAVVVQKMIFPQVSGILFTADPVTSDRKITSIDASFGLGEALVSGLVNTDVYRVRGGEILEKKISAKELAIYALEAGGTRIEKLAPEQQQAQALTDEQILELERLGRTIETRFGRPQDVEWCLVDDTFHIVQSRPITTLYPVPEAEDQENHVYVSVGHQQMMTDAMKPLGLSFFLLTTRAPMRQAGGRLFVDITPMLFLPGSRRTLIDVLGKSDPLIKDAFLTIMARSGFVNMLPDESETLSPGGNTNDLSSRGFQILDEYDPSLVAHLIAKNQASIKSLEREISTKSGTELFDFILEDIGHLQSIMSDPQSFAVIMTAMNAASWINDKMLAWLGEKNAADILSHAVPHNVTAEMGLELLDVADAIRPYPEVIDYLRQAKDDSFLDELVKLEGGPEARDAIETFLEKYGVRCTGEIDITSTRWRENPITLVPAILTNIKTLEPNASRRKFEQGQQEALEKEQELLARVRLLPEGEQKAEETKRMITLIREYTGYREYPKYGMVTRYFIYKQALLKEAERLVQAGVLRERDDSYYLTFEEFQGAVRTGTLDPQIIRQRKDDYKAYKKLTPPRVFTSDGEIITGKYKREDLPPGAIAGLPVSSGTVEGRARVVLDMAAADLEEGDILVTSFTDPSWTPLFVAIRGLVTEVGGLMTHGAVIAREYGLPAVVGVENATNLIRDGQRIRVHGAEGYVEIL